MVELSEISQVTQEIAEAINSAFDIEVEIIDSYLTRVAATGLAKRKVGQKMLYGTASQQVIKNNEEIIIRESKQHEVCMKCPGKGRCNYSGGIIVPININNHTIGTINIVTYDSIKMTGLLRRKTGLLDFLYKMSDLIASKAKEKEVLEKEIQTTSKLSTIINTVPNGLILMDENGVVSHVNNLAVKMLPIEFQSEIIGQNFKDVFLDLPFGDVMAGKEYKNIEISLYLSQNSFRYIADIKPVFGTGKISSGALVSLNYYENFKQTAYEFTNTSKIITFDDIISKSPRLEKIKIEAQQFSQGQSTILITGESGTGKELLARAIHAHSPRSYKPFISINCGAIPETLIESELFGYEKGAFTGANSSGKPGKFELANDGTIFLDEIGTMPLYLQSHLLRVLQNKEVDKIGGRKTIPINVRIISATNSNLEKMVQEGKFREDLYYRLNVIPIRIPALRERKEDVIPLVEHFVKKYRTLLGKSVEKLSKEVLGVLENHAWPGNVRELENVIEYAVNYSDPNDMLLTIQTLPPYITQKNKDIDNDNELVYDQEQRAVENIEEFERASIQKLLKKFGHSGAAKNKIARTLGISRATLYRKIKKYNMK